MKTISKDELYARFLHLEKLVIERPIGSYGWPDETSEYFEVRHILESDCFGSVVLPAPADDWSVSV